MKREMVNEFKTKIDVPSDWEVLSDEFVEKHTDLDLDGVAFSNEETLIFVSFANLPELFIIKNITPNKDHSETFETHLTREAIEKTEELFKTHR